MPTWTLTPANGTATNFDIADYKADPKGVVLTFAVNSNTGTETFHLAPEGKQAEIPGILGGGLGALSNIAGAAGGFKLAEAAISKIDGGGAFKMGGPESTVTELAGGILGAFLAHTAEQSATKLYANRDIDHGNYYNSAGQMIFAGPIRVTGDGNLVTA